MTPKEFNNWWRQHATARPADAQWLADHGAGEDGSRTLSAWWTTLKRISYADATSATEAMVTGKQRVARGEIPRAVVEWAEYLGRVRHSNNPRGKYGEDVFTCHHCQDSGTRLVFAPVAMVAVKSWPADSAITRRRLEEDSTTLKHLKTHLRTTCSVACTCVAGERWSAINPDKGKPRIAHTYDENKMVPVSRAVSDEDVERLAEHIEAAAMKRRVVEFDEFNNGF